MELVIYQVDAFTSEVFTGNPAAVVPLQDWLPDAVLQKIALENNLSETAFFVPKDDGFHLRWFTPAVEVDLCGHATLATAFVLFNQMGYDRDIIRFESRSGPLFVHKKPDGLMMDFPCWPYEQIEIEPRIIEVLGKAPIALYKGCDWIALYESHEDVLSLSPDMDRLKAIEGIRGLLPSAPGPESTDIDFVSRFFGPSVGVPEDPVTGSAHCILTPFWAERLRKTKLKARQVSARSGDLLCELKSNRVEITGQAVLYMKGVIYV